MIRVLIVDDHAVVRRGLQSMLDLEADIQVVDDADSGLSAVEKARALSPGVVLLDLKMPGMGGALACRAIKAISPHSRVLILTGVDSEQEVMTALEHGADGYVLKDAPADELLHAIRVIAGGQAYLQPSITRRVLRRLSAGSAPQPEVAAALLDEARRTGARLVVVQAAANPEGHPRACGPTEALPELEASLKAGGADLLDLSTALDQERAFTTHHHLTPEGRAAATALVAQGIGELGSLSASGGAEGRRWAAPCPSSSGPAR